jgi:2-iminobutanoate/2-iminopropanoate deaminase
MEKTVIKTDHAPKAIGPYSQGVGFGDLVFTSGQLPMDPATGELEVVCIKKATALTIENVRSILRAAGSDLDKALRATVYLKDMDNFADMNLVYAEYFGTQNPPARTCFQTAKLPLDAIIEIDVIAHR